MALVDDCSNRWGLDLVQITSSRNSASSNCLDAPRQAIRRSCKPFDVDKILSCGSDANMWAINRVTAGDTSACLFAAGSYVSGDGGPLQCFSTSGFDMRETFSMITDPVMASLSAQQQTIALPYHIPCKRCEGMCCKSILQLEEDCLKELHLRCLLASVAGKPYKGLLLELILAGNGALLSTRFLLKLAALSVKHGFYFVVDEVMTGGRSGTLLFTLQQSEAFRKRVFCITLGKWPQVGLVLTNMAIDVVGTVLQGQESMTRRGVTTTLPTSVCAMLLRECDDSQPKVDSRRKALLKRLGMSEMDCWGKGTLLFSTKAKSNLQGLRCRYLPVLEPVKFQLVTSESGYTKDGVCTTVVDGVRKWLVHSQALGGPAERGTCAYLAEMGNLSHLNTKELLLEINLFTKSKFKLGELSQVVKKMQNARLVCVQQKSKKRKRGIVCSAPVTLV